MSRTTATAAWSKWRREQKGRAITRSAIRCWSAIDVLPIPFPYIEVGNHTGQVEHEASTSKMNEEQLFYFQIARHFARRCDQYDRQWILQRCDPRTAAGICC